MDRTCFLFLCLGPDLSCSCPLTEPPNQFHRWGYLLNFIYLFFFNYSIQFQFGHKNERVVTGTRDIVLIKNKKLTEQIVQGAKFWKKYVSKAMVEWKNKSKGPYPIPWTMKRSALQGLVMYLYLQPEGLLAHGLRFLKLISLIRGWRLENTDPISWLKTPVVWPNCERWEGVHWKGGSGGERKQEHPNNCWKKKGVMKEGRRRTSPTPLLLHECPCYHKQRFLFFNLRFSCLWGSGVKVLVLPHYCQEKGEVWVFINCF